MTNDAPRMFFFDDNIRGVGGHFFELASLLIEGATELGYDPVLVANSEFRPPAECQFSVLSVLRQRRMVRWSLGVDGKSESARSADGRPLSRSWSGRLRDELRERWAWPSQQPTRMLREYAEDIAGVMTRFQINSDDTLVFNTSDDFSLLALARATEIAANIATAVNPVNVHAIFHFAIDDGPDAYEIAKGDVSDASQQSSPRVADFGRQMNQTLQRLGQHHLHVHATTEPLANQIKNAGVAGSIRPIPYPTRSRINTTLTAAGETAGSSDRSRRRVVLAGLPRAEKGRGAIASVLDQLADQIADQNSICLSMQMPAKRWRAMVPEKLCGLYEDALASSETGVPQSGPPTSSFEIMTSNLPTSTYHRWLDTAEIGLFLYEPHRYVARASGVLLEMMARGIPTLVPGRCWLGDYVSAAGSQGPADAAGCGLVYHDRDEIPGLLQQMTDNYAAFRAAAWSVARQIAGRHSGKGMLSAMGIEPAAELTASRRPARNAA